MNDELYKSCKRSFNEKHAGAGAFDTLFFASAAALCAYLFALRRLSGAAPRIVLACLAAVFVIVLSSFLNRIRFQKHVEKLRCDTGLRLFRKKLLMMNKAELGAAVMRARSFEGSELVIIQRSRPVTKDDIYEAFRGTDTGRIAIVSVSDTDAEAKLLLEGEAFRIIRFMTAEGIPQLLRSYYPTENEISEAIVEEHLKRRRPRLQIKDMLKPDRAARYLLLSAGLTAASFVSRRPLYLRLIASAAITAAALISARCGTVRRPERT